MVGPYSEEDIAERQRQFKWERSEIDYMGTDSFEHIKRRLDEAIYGHWETVPEQPSPMPSQTNLTTSGADVLAKLQPCRAEQKLRKTTDTDTPRERKEDEDKRRSTTVSDDDKGSTASEEEDKRPTTTPHEENENISKSTTLSDDENVGASLTSREERFRLTTPEAETKPEDKRDDEENTTEEGKNQPTEEKAEDTENEDYMK